jgi:hypothetical protein
MHLWVTDFMVNILDALGDRNLHCEKVFLKKESKSFIEKDSTFPLR